MKGPAAAAAAVGSSGGVKRRWKGLVIAVLGLVLLSMLVPLVFLLGLHNTFHSYSSPGFTSEEPVSDANRLQIIDPVPGTLHSSKEHVDDLLARLEPKVFGTDDKGHDAKNKTDALHVPLDMQTQIPKANNTVPAYEGKVADNIKRSGESKTLCEIRFGSYCLWREEHRENLKDSMVKKMKDLLYVARAYFPSIAKIPALDKLSHELKQNIQEFERVLSEATSDKDLPSQIEVKVERMEVTLAKVKSHPVDCNNVDKKFRQLVDLTEDEANFHMKQSAFLYQLAVQTMPKSLHCLSLRLTVDYFRSPPPDVDVLLADKFRNPELHHYVIFSHNLLASSAVINSTVMNAKETSSQVFHVLTNRQNYFAMKQWFFLNKYKEAVVQVLDVEGLSLNSQDKGSHLHLMLPEEFRVSFRSVDKLSRTWVRTEYMSLFTYSHYLMPEIFQNLGRVVILDDDVIVQKDLSELWSLDMGEKVNGATLACTVKLSQLKHYLGEDTLNEDACAWMSGLNVVDLNSWRKHDLTKRFQSLLQKLLMVEDASLEAAMLRATLIVFQGLVHDLDDGWVLSGLGYNYGLNREVIKKAAVLHFNGNMKPWLELGIPKYKGFWRKFVNRENTFLSECNVNP